jgi:SAM-dependent methyltransferase
MSMEDRQRWDRRYRDGAYADRVHPSPFLVAWLPRLGFGPERRRALDLACGLGRNSLYLAREGWAVRAVDVSPVALDRLQTTADREGLDIDCFAWDLEAAPDDARAVTPDGPVDLALIFRYANLPLVGAMRALLAPGGVLIAEMHRQTDRDVAGPSSGRFRVSGEALLAAAKGLDVLHAEDGYFSDPDGREVALARLVARRPG